jgi:hypothetical protein
VFFFYWRYTEVLAPLVPKTGPLDTAKYERAVDMLALGNAVPFVGPLTIEHYKARYFCSIAFNFRSIRHLGFTTII